MDGLEAVEVLDRRLQERRARGEERLLLALRDTKASQLQYSAGQTQARWQVLSVLSEGDWTVSRAARRLGVSRQSVQRVVDLLLNEGLLVAEPNPDHARSPLIRLTPRGREVLDRIDEVVDPWHRGFGAALSMEELRTARAALAVLMEASRSGLPPTEQR